MARMPSDRLFQRRGAALKMRVLPAYVVCIVEPPAGERPQSVVHGSVRNELVVRLCKMQLFREGFETSTVTVCTRSAV